MPRLLAPALAVICVSCVDSTPPTFTAPLPAPGPIVREVTVSGAVMEHTAGGRRPSSGTQVEIWTGESPEPVLVTSGGDGHYRLTLPQGAAFFPRLTAGASVHMPCPTAVDPVFEDTHLDLHVVSNALVTASRLPVSLPHADRQIQGWVDTGSLTDWWEVADRVAGAEVTVRATPDTPLLTRVVTDSSGRFRMCPPPGSSDGWWLDVRAAGYQSHREEVKDPSAEIWVRLVKQ